MTERIKNNSTAVLVPNPGNSLALMEKNRKTIILFLAARAETLFFDNVPVDKIGMKNERITNLEYLGNDMIEAGNEFGVGTPYGAALVRVGQAEQK